MGQQIEFQATPTVTIGHLTKKCSFWESPPFTYTHMPAVLGAANLRAADQGRIAFYPELGVIVPAAVPLVWNQDNSATGGRPGLDVTTTPSAGVTTDDTRLAGDRRFRTRYIIQSARVDDLTNWASATCEWSVTNYPESNMVTFHLNVRGSAADTATDTYTTCEWKAGANWFRAIFRLSGGVALQISRDSRATWQHYMDLVGSSGWDGELDHTVDVTLIRDRLEVLVDGMVNRITIPVSDLDPYGTVPSLATRITDAVVYAEGFVTAAAAIHPRGFLADPIVVKSAEINTGIQGLDARPGDVSWQVILDDGTVADTADVEATTSAGYPTASGLIAYDLTFKAPALADGTWYSADYRMMPPMVRYVKLQVRGRRLTVGTTTEVNVPGIKRITVQKQFNPQTLNAHTTAVIYVNNFHGIWTDPSTAIMDAPWGLEGTAHPVHGQRWGKLEMSVKAFDETGTQVTNAYTNLPYEDRGVRVYGLAGQKKGDTLTNDFDAWFSISDLSAVMMDQQLFFAPWLDGWCHYAAVRQALSWGGFDPDVHTIVGDPTATPGAIPACDDPYCTTPGHYHLPMGDGGHPLMQVPASASPWAVLQMIQSKTSHLAFFGKDGRLVYAPWDRVRTQSWSVYDTTPFAIRFGMHTSQGTPGELASRVQNLSSNVDQGTALNDLAVVGLDAYGPRWFPVVARRELSDGWLDTMDARFKGYRARGAVIDSKFASLSAADTFATELFGYSQWPDQRISFTTLAGPSMEPLVRVYVYPYSSSGLNRSSASGAYYRVMSTSESWDWQSKMYTMNVEAINIR